MRRRQGFTITELLVAMALIVFIMYILAEAFSAGSGAFRNLKAIGDMNEKLRGTSQTLRRYLEADHFEGKKRLSDPDFWKDGPPNAGFLRIFHGSPAVFEGSDLDGNLSYQGVNHGLHFTVKLRGNSRNEFFRASVPSNSPLLLLPFQDSRFQEPLPNPLPTPPPTTWPISSSWGEVAVFAVDSGDLAEDVDNLSLTPQKLYTLHLRQRLCVPDNEALGATKVPFASQADYADLSCHQDPRGPANLYFNNPSDLTMPVRRMGLIAPNNVAGLPASLSGPVPATNYPTLPGGDDVLLTNVLSFDVRVLLDRQQWTAYNTATAQNLPHDFVPLHHNAIQQFSNNNPGFAAPNGPKVFDTWSQMKDDNPTYDYSNWSTGGQQTSIPLYRNTSGQFIRIVAIQITIRIWDSNTKQTRQSSIVVDM